MLITVALLAFVAASFAALAFKKPGQAPPQDEPAPVPMAAVPDKAAADNPPTDGVMACYFHADFRCPTCQKIEAYAHEAVQSGFAKELADGKVVWRILNYEEPANTHFADEYKIIAPTVVLVSYKGGTLTAWKNLMKVWELVSDKGAFSEYIREEVRTALQEAAMQAQDAT
jgi:hypothetical protein